MTILYEVMTVTEVEQCFRLAKNTVRQHMHRHGREMIECSTARKSVGTWLLVREAAEEIWGRGQQFEIVSDGWDVEVVSRSEAWIMAHDWSAQHGERFEIRQVEIGYSSETRVYFNETKPAETFYGDGMYSGDQQFAIEVMAE